MSGPREDYGPAKPSGTKAVPSPGGFSVDLTNCDREPIHQLGAIQPFGFLLAVSADWIVQHVSTNSADWLGRKPDELLGLPAGAVLSDDIVHALRNRLQYLRGIDGVERLFRVRIAAEGPPLDLAVHLSGRSIIIEGERSPAEDSGSASGTVRAMLARLKAARNLDALLNNAARLLQALTGYDRVMVYRFAENGSGEVVAESLRGTMESFLGQRFPASDIPRQARELYLRNWTRIIGDVAGEPVPIVPSLDPAGEPLDLSMSVLRSVSPIHLEYLSNMGLRGSMSVSVIVGGRLWGLLACHHDEPLVVPFETRSAAELFGQVFSLLLESREREEEAAYDERAQLLHRQLMGTLAAEATTAQNIAAYFDEMREVLGCHGVGLWIDGTPTLSGTTPSPGEFGEVVRFLNRAAASQIYATHHLSATYTDGERLLPRVAGLLAVPISRTPRDYLVFFRKEVASTVTWAGDPAKAVTPGPVGPNGPRLTPRKSFEAWQEVVSGQSTPWSTPERRFADALRVTMLEVVLRLTEVAAREREKARQKQELLIAELNHRVRNILALMRAIVGQSRDGVENVESFADVLGDRIQALARAHDQITRDQWGPASLRSLIEAETTAYLANKADRVRMSGPDLLLQPQAFSTLALVFHELVTNAAKHGALCDSSGSIAVDWRLDEQGDLEIVWREAGGPAVQAPARRGFGSTIIERSVPYDLHGSAQVDFALAGLSARFRVPAQHIVAEAGQRNAGSGRPAAGESARAAAPAAPKAGRALIVEDNMIVAMEAEDMLRELGFASADCAPSVAVALRIIASQKPDFALLDINLGRETSFPIADRLAELGVPFVFATGYGDQATIPDPHGDRLCLSKPFNRQMLRRAVDGWRSGGGQPSRSRAP